MGRLIAALAAVALFCAVADAQAQERPQPPTAAFPSAPDIAVCGETSARTTFLAAFETELNGAMETGREIARHHEALAQWKHDQMLQRGLWTEAEGRQFALDVLSDPEFTRRTEASMAEAMQLMTHMMGYAEGGDDAQRCQSAVEAWRTMERVMQGADAQWSYMGELYDAEAHRRGGSLD